MPKFPDLIVMISRKHPPQVGGMEIMSQHLINGVGGSRRVLPIVWRGSQWGLPWFLAIAACRLTWALLRNRARLVHLGDPVLAPLAWLAFAARVPVVVTIHGLDFVYPNRAYQYLLRLTLPRCAALVCISTYVRTLVLAQGLPPENIWVIPVGIAREAMLIDKTDLGWQTMGMTPETKVILFIGRLVERKGVAWFVSEVFAPLTRQRNDLHLVVIGKGPEQARIAELCRVNDVSAKVHILGALPEAMKWAWLRRAMLLVVPNVGVKGDVEGFGIVALEGALAARPVLAARLEGLVDPVRDGVGGWLLPPGDAGAWLACLNAGLDDEAMLVDMGAKARKDVLERFSWDRIVEQYCAVFDRYALVSN
jgi:glycosyltransferase involved in cell wall biosynthesis